MSVCLKGRIKKSIVMCYIYAVCITVYGINLRRVSLKLPYDNKIICLQISLSCVANVYECDLHVVVSLKDSCVDLIILIFIFTFNKINNYCKHNQMRDIVIIDLKTNYDFSEIDLPKFIHLQ